MVPQPQAGGPGRSGMSITIFRRLGIGGATRPGSPGDAIAGTDAVHVRRHYRDRNTGTDQCNAAMSGSEAGMAPTAAPGPTPARAVMGKQGGFVTMPDYSAPTQRALWECSWPQVKDFLGINATIWKRRKSPTSSTGKGLSFRLLFGRTGRWLRAAPIRPTVPGGRPCPRRGTRTGSW
jgi:hypothetical protein